MSYPDLAWIRSHLRNSVPRVRYPVLALYVVGSTAKGTAGPDSDLDLAIVIEPVRGKTSLKFTEHYHARQWKPPTWLNRSVDFQFFYPDDLELSTYSKIVLYKGA